MRGIPLRIARELGAPILRLGIWKLASIPAIMPVPEAPIHEDHLAMARQNKIGTARQITPVQPETISKRMHGAPHDHLRACIRLADARHALGKGESGVS